MTQKQAYDKAYRQKNIEKITTREKAYRLGRKEHIKAYNESYRKENKEKIKAHRESTIDHVHEVHRAYSVSIREKILDHYGRFCACCGETELKFLTIDHINNDGATHRKKVGHGAGFYRWLINNNFPEGFQTLCWNCNCGRRLGPCPHEIKLVKLAEPKPISLFLDHLMPK